MNHEAMLHHLSFISNFLPFYLATFTFLAKRLAKYFLIRCWAVRSGRITLSALRAALRSRRRTASFRLAAITASV
jgi:hypothetical protein